MSGGHRLSGTFLWYFSAAKEDMMKTLIIGGTSSLGCALKPVFSKFGEVITAGRKNCDITMDLNGCGGPGEGSNALAQRRDRPHDQHYDRGVGVERTTASYRVEISVVKDGCHVSKTLEEVGELPSRGTRAEEPGSHEEVGEQSPHKHG